MRWGSWRKWANEDLSWASIPCRSPSFFFSASWLPPGEQLSHALSLLCLYLVIGTKNSRASLLWIGTNDTELILPPFKWFSLTVCHSNGYWLSQSIQQLETSVPPEHFLVLLGGRFLDARTWGRLQVMKNQVPGLPKCSAQEPSYTCLQRYFLSCSPRSWKGIAFKGMLPPLFDCFVLVSSLWNSNGSHRHSLIGLCFIVNIEIYLSEYGYTLIALYSFKSFIYFCLFICLCACTRVYML